MKVFKNIFNRIISAENLFLAWDKFRSDKQKKPDVLLFERYLEQNIFQLHRDLKTKRYKHGHYVSFFIQDPKQRHIHKAAVRDRVLHHAVFSVLNPLFEPTFIPCSFSCRIGKGTHKGVLALESMIRQASRNYTRPCLALKCDIRKFFESVDHTTLLGILEQRILDQDAMWLLREIIESFTSRRSTTAAHKGLPIGNLTSQLFVNIYLNEFDQFVKHQLRVRHYVRYTDDFVILDTREDRLKNLLQEISYYLSSRLALDLHPKKITIRKPIRGVDFLGYVLLPHHRSLRTKTKRRIFRKLKKRAAEYKAGLITEQTLNQCLQSYLGVLSHADAYELTEQLNNYFWFWLKQ